MASSQLLLSLAAAVPAALLSGVLTWAIRPLLVRIALAKPNARSSHRIPTPQGGGIAVIAATLIAAVTVIAFAGAADMKIPVAVFGATLFIAAVGFADDVNSIPVVPRLLLQGLAVAAVILATPENLRIVPACPLWLERGLLLLAGLWFVNLVNFMDGLDLMTVAEIVPITGALVLLGWLAELPAPATIAAAALFGAMLGFAPFNRPLAKIFLGDVGSLPIGLLLAWLLILLAGSGHVAAALLLPLYYLADATLTLARRLLAGEQVWQAHRTHFYQRATDGGFAVTEIVARVFAVNVVLAALAFVTVTVPAWWSGVAAVAAGAVLVGWLLWTFARGRRRA
jgi:UDP-N-acetylmuramyl pentapeptide phosphotransferase/UDP-N-acetylglucosamine-1-phosphate transferase